MYAGLRVDTCGGCGQALTYRRESHVPTGWVFKCTNVLCGNYGIEYSMPVMRCYRFFPVVEDSDAA